ncbi:MAG: NUDIX domain-containing protein [Myxococcales bacterium]|nr:MAG: NUDIX domain-containing protein [Myxococcales bacterium]
MTRMTSPEERADLAVVIGRFQPFHLGHLALLEHALAVAPRALLVVGSASGPRQAKNPFSAEERVQTIKDSLAPEQLARVSFATVRDYYDEARWAGAVKGAVAALSGGPVALVGFHKDDSSSYLSIFPEWRELALPRQAPIDGTALRRLYFEQPELAPELAAAVPAGVARFLEAFRSGPHFEPLREELAALDQSRAKYGSGPFVTLDALVTYGERILLVERGGAPGKGQWALPGGFLDGSERLLNGALRELREETLIGASDAELRAALRAVAVFDHPQRSQRGRTITHAHYFALPPIAAQPPSVKGADDARAAQWLPIAELPRMTEQLFEDHYQIIDHFLRVSSD